MYLFDLIVPMNNLIMSGINPGWEYLLQDLLAQQAFLQTDTPWLTLGISLGSGLLATFIIYTILLRRSLRRHTLSLQESEEKYRRFFMTSKDPVFITTADDSWVDVNQATVELLGYDSQEELFQTPVSQAYLDPAERTHIIKDLERKGFIQDLPVDLIDRDGNVLHTLLTTSAIFNDEGDAVGFQGTIRDNTHWISSQQKLRQSRENIDQAFTGTGAGLWDWNIKSNTIEINNRWAEIIGSQKADFDDLTIEAWEELCHPEDLEESNKRILQHFAGDTYHYQVEMRMKHSDGHWIWILNQGRVVERDRDRSPLRMVGTTQDITDRIKIREEIQEYADQLEALHTITQSLSSTLSLSALLDLILEKLEEALAFDSASIFLYEKGELRIETVRNHPRPELVVGKTFPTSNPLFQEMYTKRKPIIIDNATKDARFQGWGQMHHVRGWLGVPLIIQDEFIGYITMDSRKQSAFGTPEAKLAMLFASQAAQTIQNARLYEQVTQYTETLETRIANRTKELTKMVEHMTGREIRMIELKGVIKTLRQQLLDNDIEPEAQDPLKDGIDD